MLCWRMQSQICNHFILGGIKDNLNSIQATSEAKWYLLSTFQTECIWLYWRKFQFKLIDKYKKIANVIADTRLINWGAKTLKALVQSLIKLTRTCALNEIVLIGTFLSGHFT
jgi:hypothetical protein